MSQVSIRLGSRLQELTQKGCAKIKIFLSIAPSPTLFISVQYTHDLKLEVVRRGCRVHSYEDGVGPGSDQTQAQLVRSDDDDNSDDDDDDDDNDDDDDD